MCRLLLFFGGLRINTKKKSKEEIISILKKHGFNVTTENFEYKNNKSKFYISCPVGHILYTSFNAISKKYSCKECNGYIPKYSYNQVLEEFSKHECTLLTKTYTNNKQKLQYVCSCGNKAFITFHDFKSGVRCRKCSGSMKYTYSEVKEIFETQGCRLLSLEYKSNKEKLDYICTCGNTSSIQLSNFINGVRCMECYRKNNKKENHLAWNPLLTDEERVAKRKFLEYKNWRNSVFDRDQYTCQCCGDITGGNLNAHHLNGWNWAIDERICVHNGVTLCDICHDDFHHFYGYGDNTKEQYEEWKKDIKRGRNKCEQLL